MPLKLAAQDIRTAVTHTVSRPIQQPSAADPLLWFANMQASQWKAVMKWQVDQMKFIKHRYEQDMKLVDDLLETPDPAEMLNLYACFLQNALDDYSKEAANAASLGSKFMADSAREIRLQAKARVNDLMAATVA